MKTKTETKGITLSKAQERTIANYRAAGIDIDFPDPGKVRITQARLLNGYILNNEQLYVRAREAFPDHKVVPVVYSLNVEDITIPWIESKMEEHGIGRKDLIQQLAIDKASLSKIFTGVTSLSKPMRALFYYYFLTYELNRDFRSEI